MNLWVVVVGGWWVALRPFALWAIPCLSLPDPCLSFTISTAFKWGGPSDPIVKSDYAATLPSGRPEAGGGRVARPGQAGQEEDDSLLRRQEVQEQDRDRVRAGERTRRRGRAQVGSTKFCGT